MKRGGTREAPLRGSHRLLRRRRLPFHCRCPQETLQALRDSSESFLDREPDFCEPCPDNGHCSNGELKCFHGYKKHGRRCLEDGSINQTAKELAEGLEDHVCDSYAQFLCGKVGQTWVCYHDHFHGSRG
ncbi:hypothetical protein J5N97_029584 [Dioscorea zingiberensis]|uniref:Uncharacterized protein n=1 Tax=Dioscorea zingiberensis TaxID=325984 RepID=A0A9D5H3G0_9LILI|nr:hypothetical protein J5N97_029584 [Dioscorea zingiberensis]